MKKNDYDKMLDEIIQYLDKDQKNDKKNTDSTRKQD